MNPRAWKSYGKVQIQTSNGVEATIMAYEVCLKHLKQSKTHFEAFKFSEADPFLIKTEQIINKLRGDLNRSESLPAELKDLITNLNWCYESILYHLNIVKMTKNKETLELVMSMIQDLLDGYRGASAKPQREEGENQNES